MTLNNILELIFLIMQIIFFIAYLYCLCTKKEKAMFVCLFMVFLMNILVVII